jgi:hypothetical protein
MTLAAAATQQSEAATPEQPGEEYDEDAAAAERASIWRPRAQVNNDRSERNIIRSAALTMQPPLKAQLNEKPQANVQIVNAEDKMKALKTVLDSDAAAHAEALAKATTEVVQARAWAQHEVAAAEAETQLERARAAEASSQVLHLENELKVARSAALATSSVTAQTAMEPQLELLQEHVVSLQVELALVTQARACAQKKVTAAEAGTQLDRAWAAEVSSQVLQLEEELKKVQAAALSTFGVSARTAMESQLKALQEHVVSLQAELASSLVSADAKAAADGVIKSLKAQLSAQAAASASAITAQAEKLMSLENLLENRAQESDITLKDATEQGKLWQESFAALKESSDEADSQVAALRQQSKDELTATATATADKQRANFEQREKLLAEVEGLKKKLISIAASGVEARSAVAKDLAEAVEARAWAEKEVAAAEAQAKAARAEIESLKKELASQAPSRARALAEAAEARTWAENKVAAAEAQAKAAKAETERSKTELVSQASSGAKALVEAAERARAWAEKEVAAVKAESKSASEASAQLLKVTEAKAAAATSNGSSEERSVMEAQVAAKAEKVARLCMTLQSEVQRLKAELASERSRPSPG